MNEQRNFIRKIAYVCAVAVLLLPLSYLSQPATTESDGGQLAQFRQAHQLSQKNLGEIDATGETMKLATLGMRGVAANLLWEKASYYKKVEDWTSYSATLEQITRLQPNFVSVWQFLGWNLSYNVAVEFDDYHDRYRWIIRGIDFLKEGTHYNASSPRLLSDIGWYLSNKIGRADEHVLYRELFRADDDFHNSDDPTRRRSQRDNWLVGMGWFERAEKLVDDFGVSLKKVTPSVFFANKPMCQINYADALEDEGTFGEVAKLAWEKGAKAFAGFGNRDLPTTYNIPVRLNDQERFTQRAKEDVARLDEVAPGLRDKLRAERIAKLPPDKRAILEMPTDQRSPEQASEAIGLEMQVTPSHYDVAERVPGKDRVAALQLAKAAADDEQMVRIIDMEREVVNFKYWRDRCEMERDDTTVAARKAIHQADRAFESARLQEAGKLYEEGLQQWRKVLDAHPNLAAESTLLNDLYDMIDRYGNYLHQVESEIPKDFILQDVVRAWQTINRTAPQKKWVPPVPEILYPNAKPATEEKPAEPATGKESNQGKPAEPTKAPADGKPAQTDGKPTPTEDKPAQKEDKPGATDVKPGDAAKAPDGAAPAAAPKTSKDTPQ